MNEVLDIELDETITEPLDVLSSDLRSMRYWTTKASQRIEQIMDGGFVGYKTGLRDLDRFLMMRPTEYTIIGAQSSMGKTALGMQIVESICEQIESPGCVCVFSAEMSGASLVLRMSANIAGVSIHKMGMGKCTKEELQRMKATTERLRSMPIWIDDASSPTTHDMLVKLRMLNQALPVKAMLFDFLELAGDENRSEEQKIAHVSKRLKAIAKTLEIPVISLSQCNDDANKRNNKIPAISDLRYSRASSHLADNVVLIMRPSYYLEKGIPVEGYDKETAKGIAVFVVGKQREGPTGMIECVYLEEKMRFADKARVL